MAKFYFHIYDGFDTDDDEGLEPPNATAARVPVQSADV